jgi:hypothetical protein
MRIIQKLISFLFLSFLTSYYGFFEKAGASEYQWILFYELKGFSMHYDKLNLIALGDSHERVWVWTKTSFSKEFCIQYLAILCEDELPKETIGLWDIDCKFRQVLILDQVNPFQEDLRTLDREWKSIGQDTWAEALRNKLCP